MRPVWGCGLEPVRRCGLEPVRGYGPPLARRCGPEPEWRCGLGPALRFARRAEICKKLGMRLLARREVLRVASGCCHCGRHGHVSLRAAAISSQPAYGYDTR